METRLIPTNDQTRRMAPGLWLLVVAFLGWGCRTAPAPADTVNSVMDGVVTRLYAELDKSQLDTISNAFMAQYLTLAEKDVLASAYWQFDVNVPVVVSVMRDSAQGHAPFWLAERGFQKTDKVVRNRLSTYEVWQATFPNGRVGLGINGFDRHRPVYFVSVAPQNPGDKVEIKPIFPQEQHIGVLEVGAFTYHDWDGLLLDEVPTEMRGQALLTTIRGRAREAHVLGAFRTTEFPSGERPDQIRLTLPADPKTGMTIQWRSEPNVTEAWASYWPAHGTDTVRVPASHVLLEDRQLQNDRYASQFTAQLENLLPGTEYQYTVGHDGAVSDTLGFATAGDGGKFSFVWVGDVHNDPRTGELLQLADRKHPGAAFYILAGDLVNTGLYRNDWDGLFGYAGKVFGHKPLMAVPGNHDSQDGLGAGMYQQLLHYPHNGPAGLSPGLTYAFRYQNALFLMIDVVSFSAAAQRDWIADQLANTDAVWKFAVFHFPPYTNEEPYIDIEQEWVPLFDEYGVDMAMNGHFHYYLRTQPMQGGKVVGPGQRGTTYVMSVGTRSKNEQGGAEPHAAKRANQGYLYQYVSIDGNQLTHTSLDADGQVIDAFGISK